MKSQNSSKFIVNTSDEQNNNSIIIPYYPLGTLESFILQNGKEKSGFNVELTLVDKVVMILEIATALKDLHDNKEYHGNLSSQSIYISSSKDAYIGSFYYDRSKEVEDTRPKGPFYYRPPEIFQLDEENKTNGTDVKLEIKDQQVADVYSFGVMMHEIITETNPETRMGEMSADKRLSMLTGDYCGFLFSGKNNEYFNEDSDCFFDERGNSMFGVRSIIDKCMKRDARERYSFGKIIESIHVLPIYSENKTEIEARISHAPDSREYECHFSDLVESYYRGNSNMKKEILDIFDVLNKSSAYPSSGEEEDIFLNFYQLMSVEPSKSLPCLDNLSHILDFIIQKNINCIEYQNSLNYSSPLYSLSMKANIEQRISINRPEQEFSLNYVTPICTITHFVKKSQYNCSLSPEDKLLFSYIISTEVSQIHSHGFHHGELSTDAIGIYYNHDTKTFVPSVILFYPFFKQQFKQNQKQEEHDHESSDENISCESDENENDCTEPLQQKDIDDFISILMELGIDESIIDEILKIDTMNLISAHLYRLIQNKPAFYVFDANRYLNPESLQINFITINDIIIKPAILNSIDPSFFNIKSVLEDINEFLNEFLGLSTTSNTDENTEIIKSIKIKWYSDIPSKIEYFLSKQDKNKNSPQSKHSLIAIEENVNDIKNERFSNYNVRTTKLFKETE